MTCQFCDRVRALATMRWKRKLAFPFSQPFRGGKAAGNRPATQGYKLAYKPSGQVRSPIPGSPLSRS